MVSREAIDESRWLELLAARLRRAIERRKPTLNSETDACRLCFSEADELPGLVIDKYADLVILQLLAKGLDSAAVRETCVRVLREELRPALIVERPDPRMRELEGLAAPGSEPLFIADTARSAAQNPIPAQWAGLPIRCQCRTEDRRLSRSAGKLCGGARSGPSGSRAWAVRSMCAATRAALRCIWPQV